MSGTTRVITAAVAAAVLSSCVGTSSAPSDVRRANADVVEEARSSVGTALLALETFERGDLPRPAARIITRDAADALRSSTQSWSSEVVPPDEETGREEVCDLVREASAAVAASRDCVATSSCEAALARLRTVHERLSDVEGG